ATYRTVDENLSLLRTNKFSVNGELVKEYMMWNFPILTHSALFKKSFLIGKSLFDPSIKRGQESDFYLNILPLIRKDNFSVFEEPTFLYRLHENTITAKTKKYNPDYMPSLLRIRYKALKVGQQLKDDELIKNSYLHLILLLFQLIKNKD